MSQQPNQTSLRLHPASASCKLFFTIGGSTLQDLDTSSMPVGRGQPSVQGQQRRSQHLGQRDVGGVVGRHAAPKLPDAWEQNIVGITDDGQIDKVGERLSSPLRTKITRQMVSPKNLSHLHIEQVRGVK